MSDSDLTPTFVGYIERLGLDASDLDELVHEMKGAERAASYNSGIDDEEHGLSADDELDAFDEAYSDEASEINNGGLEAQVAFLLEALGEVELTREARRIAAAKPEPAT